MKLSNEVTLSLSNQDLCDLMADALADNVLQVYGSKLVVGGLYYNESTLRWGVTFEIKEKEE